MRWTVLAFALVGCETAAPNGYWDLTLERVPAEDHDCVDVNARSPLFFVGLRSDEAFMTIDGDFVSLFEVDVQMGDDDTFVHDEVLTRGGVTTNDVIGGHLLDHRTADVWIDHLADCEGDGCRRISSCTTSYIGTAEWTDGFDTGPSFDLGGWGAPGGLD